MNALWVYAYVVMPLIVVAMGYAAVWLTDPARSRRNGPAE
ncbi:hypothetical protein GCM10007301_22110 [Azorhizobium oxalatiphilum]|uniref:Transmembrane protein n=1 Tax=Azorhizobium oxalatiphilum TaxID=980631 RepID=A0A917BXQ4_9HYPH|nr:hypothetical protein GCM10007301_22110 [Azorhizobium oxalatiphilum]